VTAKKRRYEIGKMEDACVSKIVLYFPLLLDINYVSNTSFARELRRIFVMCGLLRMKQMLYNDQETFILKHD